MGELLRREGLYSTDLARIRQQVKEGALQRLSAKPGKPAEPSRHRSLRRPQARTPGQGTGPGGSVGRTGDPAKKNEWGFVGPIAGQWIKEQTKLEILTVIETSQQQGVSARRSCSILVIAHRRIVRWQQQARQGQSLANLTPGPKAPLHRVLPEEIDQIVALAKSVRSMSTCPIASWRSRRGIKASFRPPSPPSTASSKRRT